MKLSNHRRYKKARILVFLREKKKFHDKKKVALYGRIFSTHQKASRDLNRQLALHTGYFMRKGYHLYKAYSDVGSRLNGKWKSLLKLLQDATVGKFDVVLASHKDCLSHFGYNSLKLS
ncbi:MAG: hypothetical protein ACTSU4_14225 [Promethearchaeota archaeon]